MDKTRLLPALLSVVFLFVGCDKSKDDSSAEAGEATPIDCAWFDADNCFQDVLAGTVACAAPSRETGTFSADRTRCTYSDGTEIRFAEAVPLDLFDDDEYLWNYEIIKSGSSCMTFTESANSMDLVSSVGTFSESAAGMTVILECPDGARFSIGAFDMLDCDWNRLPGYTVMGGGEEVSFAFLGEESPILFHCAP